MYGSGAQLLLSLIGYSFECPLVLILRGSNCLMSHRGQKWCIWDMDPELIPNPELLLELRNLLQNSGGKSPTHPPRNAVVKIEYPIVLNKIVSFKIELHMGHLGGLVG